MQRIGTVLEAKMSNNFSHCYFLSTRNKWICFNFYFALVFLITPIENNKVFKYEGKDCFYIYIYNKENLSHYIQEYFFTSMVYKFYILTSCMFKRFVKALNSSIYVVIRIMLMCVDFFVSGLGKRDSIIIHCNLDYLGVTD